MSEIEHNKHKNNIKSYLQLYFPLFCGVKSVKVAKSSADNVIGAARDLLFLKSVTKWEETLLWTEKTLTHFNKTKLCRRGNNMGSFQMEVRSEEVRT